MFQIVTPGSEGQEKNQATSLALHMRPKQVVAESDRPAAMRKSIPADSRNGVEKRMKVGVS